ncbi:uncharacterized protein BO80DRAFT_61999 [Aspergillus ibericus CBS 121593]|uniref:Uncharacterized protein n=1 Tax=Aspergillus ibericus CBS 121593 TaxID=1448316 RepID=A0A395H2B4_9EURO|nr:hypothetical protein BO80DRAFT_61999 [Aspergillus ibericus CBS 121593]RAL01539.1 hypothetical protein BO80DRAFT_61999 [Aspergillus ibericus CBS 121593]
MKPQRAKPLQLSAILLLLLVVVVVAALAAVPFFPSTATHLLRFLFGAGDLSLGSPGLPFLFLHTLINLFQFHLFFRGSYLFFPLFVLFLFFFLFFASSHSFPSHPVAPPSCRIITTISIYLSACSAPLGSRMDMDDEASPRSLAPWHANSSSISSISTAAGA